MTKIFAYLLLCTSIFISGCATSNYSVGNDFNSQNVKKIVKGKTNIEDLIRLFGQPFSKSVISASEEKWMYYFHTGSVSAYAMSTKSKSNQKTLDLLLENETVINFSFNNGPLNSNVSVLN